MHARAAWPFRVYARSVPAYALALVSVVPGLAWADAPPAQCGVATTPFTRVPALPALNAGGATTFTMKVAGVGTVWDVDVQTFLRHSYTSDLSVTLTSPAGTTVTLSSRNGADLDDIFNGTLWDDQAKASGGDAVTLATFTNGVAAPRLSPEEPLAAFRDEDPNGTWTLTVTDFYAPLDTGRLDSWSLTLHTTAGAPFTVTVNPAYAGPSIPTVDLATVTATVTVAAGSLVHPLSDVRLFAGVSHSRSGDLVIALTSPAGTTVTMSSGNGGNVADVFGGALWSDTSQFPVTDEGFTPRIAFSPQEPFARFAGESTTGTWTLSVRDAVAGQSGTLNSFSLVLEAAPCAYAAPTTEGETEETGFTNNTAATATQMQMSGGVVGMAIGAIRPIGAAPAGDDIDYWKFNAVAGARVWATVDAGGVQHAGATTRDTYVSVVAINGTTLLASDDDDGPGTGGDATLEAGGSSNVAGIVIPTTGTYYLRIHSGSVVDRAIDPYRVYLVVSSEPTRPEETGFVPVGGTQTLRTTTRIARMRGAITAGETDQYQINYLPAGSLIFISVDGDPDRATSSFNPRIVFDNTAGLGSPLITINRAVSQPFVESMAYYLPAGASAMYFGIGGDINGDYEVMVTVMQRRVADRQLTRTHSPNPAVPGQNLAATYTLSNLGPADDGPSGFGLVLVPAAGAYQRTTGVGMLCSGPPPVGTPLILCDSILDLPSGGSASATVTQAISSGVVAPVSQGGSIVPPLAPVDLLSQPPAADYNTVNDSVSATIPVAPLADLSVTATALPPALAAGASFVVTAMVSNTGPSTAGTASLAVVAPANAAVVSLLAPAGWTCPTLVSCTSPTLAPGASASFSITFSTTAAAPGGTVIAPVITVATAATDPSPANNAATASVVITNVTVTDTDGDTLLNDFESTFGLDPLSPVGHNGPAGDPDGDGFTNAEEQMAGTHPLGLVQRYFAEGSTGTFFDERLAIINPSTVATALVQVRYLRPAPQPAVMQNFTIHPNTRRTIEVDTVPGVENTAVSIVIESDLVVVADRTLTWDSTGYGAHSETAVSSASTSWYFAEGTTASGFDLFYLLQNAGTSPAHVTVTYLRPAPAAPVVRTYVVDPTSRFNIWVDTEGPELSSTDVSATITSDKPIIAERAMYRDAAGQTFGAGHDSVGVTAPAAQWFLAEGATGPFFDLFILIANPGAAPADVEARYLTPDGSVIVRTYTVAGQSRYNIWVDFEDPALADTAVSTSLSTTNGTRIIVERALWWPAPLANWYEAHNSAGATSTATRWAIAEGETGGARGVDTYILLANPTSTAASIKVTLLFEDGTTTDRTFAVAANSRFNVWTRAEFPSTLDRRYGAIIESLGASAPGVIVERAMYWDAGGQLWAAGTNALAARLP